MANVNGSILGQQAITVAKGDTAARPSGVEGMLRFNNELHLLEYYNSVGEWVALDAPPAVTSISPTTFNGEQGTTITITGNGFKSGCLVKFVDVNNTVYNSPVVTFTSETQITATTPQDFTVAMEPIDIVVSNPSGLTGTLDNALDCGGVPVWSTTSGNIYDGADDVAVSATIAATDPDAGATISYAVASGLPSGVTVSSSGTFSGTPADVSSATTYTFNATATDNAGNTAGSRSFNIVLRPTLSSAGSYPISGSNYSLYTTAWTASSSDLYNLSHTSSTFRVPANVYAIRVMIWGAAQINLGSVTAGYGGYTSAILRVTPLEYYKVICGGGGTIGSSNGGSGGYGQNGLGGGCSQDSNDNSVGGAGSGFFYAANTGGTTVTSEATMFTKGVLIAGGGGGGSGANAGNGNGANAGAQSLTVAGISGYAIGGGNGSSNANGAKYTGQGGDMYNSGNSMVAAGGAVGYGGTFAQDGFGSGYGGGSGGGRGGGGAGGGSNSSVAGENATGDGGRGSANYSNAYNPQTGPGAGGYGPYNSTGGNGFRFNSINLGGGGAAGHGQSQAGGGWSGGGSDYYSRGGGGGSGCAFGYMSGTTPTLSTWVAPSSVSVNGGSAQSICSVPSTAGSPRTLSDGSGYNGAVLITW